MIAIIAAVARNGVIGKDGKIPWKLSADLQRFKALTMGGVLLMGRKTYDSIGRPLPGRETIVLTRQPLTTPIHSSVTYVESFESALKLLAQTERSRGLPVPTFICGGAEVYREALALSVADKLYLTKIDADFEGDTFMPEIDYSRWQPVSGSTHSAPEAHPFAYSFLDYEAIR